MYKKILITITVLVLLVLAIAPSYYFYQQYQRERNKNSVELAEEELKTVIRKVSTLIELPTGEEPILATVSESEKLQNQPFFTRSQNGDKVLIFTQAKKAYLYRPSTHKLIEVATVSLNSDLSSQQETATPAVPQTVEVVIRNGSGQTGLATRIEAEMKNLSESITIARRENAARSNYPNTFVVLINREAAATANQIAEYFNTSIQELPAEETQPIDADVLIILGRNSLPTPTVTSTPTP
jgi:hypothetical protein